METLSNILFILQAIIAFCLVGLILIQHGKGADAGAAFGSGASATIFGAQGSGNFLTKATMMLAILFLGNSLFLAYLATQATDSETISVMDSVTSVEGEVDILDSIPEEENSVVDSLSDLEQSNSGNETFLEESTVADTPYDVPDGVSESMENSLPDDIPPPLE